MDCVYAVDCHKHWNKLLHRYCPLANNVEYFNCLHVWACLSTSHKSAPFRGDSNPPQSTFYRAHPSPHCKQWFLSIYPLLRGFQKCLIHTDRSKSATMGHNLTRPINSVIDDVCCWGLCRDVWVTGLNVQAASHVVNVHRLRSQADCGILDNDDLVRDIAADKEQVYWQPVLHLWRRLKVGYAERMLTVILHVNSLFLNRLTKRKIFFEYICPRVQLMFLSLSLQKFA